MTTPDTPYRFELELTVSATPEQVWDAIASADGISAWMLPTELDPREGGAVKFHMGPDGASEGTVTAFEPTRRIAYEEDWATLVGHAGADVTPLVTEFLVEARSGGTCVVRVVSSAYGTGADWENEFWGEMNAGCWCLDEGASDRDSRSRGLGIAGVRCARRLNEEQLGLFFGERLMLDTDRHDEELSRTEDDLSVG